MLDNVALHVYVHARTYHITLFLRCLLTNPFPPPIGHRLSLPLQTTVEGGLGYAVALQVPILTMIDISAAWLHYRKLDWRTVKILLPLSFVGMYIGQTVDK